jgi:hypothetical protein
VTVNSVLALDPGLTKPGIAFWHNGRLIRADRLLLSRHLAKLGIADRCERVAHAAMFWVENIVLVPDIIVVEFPQWYGRNAKGIDPNDLAGLSGIACAFVAHCRLLWSPREIVVRSPKPREVWGTLPKATTGDPWASPRARRLASRLTPEERSRVASYHDAIDAAGLAMWGAGLWKARSNYPGAV